jgi:hypothetical protein
MNWRHITAISINVVRRSLRRGSWWRLVRKGEDFRQHSMSIYAFTSGDVHLDN